MRKNSYTSQLLNQQLSIHQNTQIFQLINKFSDIQQSKFKQYQQQISQVLINSSQLISKQFQNILASFQKINAYQLKTFLFFTNIYFNGDRKQQNRAMKIINQCIGKAQEILTPKDINQIINFMISLCCNKKNICINFKIEDQSLLKQKVLKMKLEEINNNNIINILVLSALYNTLTQICFERNSFFILLLTYIVTRIKIVKDDYFDKNVENVFKVLEKKSITQNQLQILIKIVSGLQISDIISNNIKKQDNNIQLKFKKLLFLAYKKLLKQKQIKNRTEIFQFLMAYTKHTFFQHNHQFFVTAISSIQKQEDPVIDQLLHNYIVFQIKNQMSYKKIKTLFKNLKVHSTTKQNTSQSFKLLKNYQFIQILNQKNSTSYPVLQFQSKKSAVFFQNLNIKPNYTIFLHAKLKSNINQYSYLLTLTSKKLTLEFSIKQNTNKKKTYFFRCTYLQQKKNQQYEIQLDNSQGFFSLATHQQGFVITASNFCFLLPIHNLQIKNIILGNSVLSVDNKRLTQKTAIKQVNFFCVSQQFYEITNLLSLCKQRQVLQKKLKKILQEQKLIIFFEGSGSWNIVNNKNKILKFLTYSQNVIEIDCLRGQKQSFKKLLIRSQNIDIFFILIEYYIHKLKQTELLLISQKIFSLIVSFAEQDEQNLIFNWIDRSIDKISIIIWILSQTQKQKKQLILKILKLIFMFQENKGLSSQRIRQFRYKFIKNILFKCQIWRNYCFQDQIIIYDTLQKKLHAKQQKFIKQAIQTNDIRKILISLLIYYKLDQNMQHQHGIQRKLSKQQLLSIHLFLKQIYVRGINQNYKQKINQMDKKIMEQWVNHLKYLFDIALLTNQPQTETEANQNFSKQYFFQLLQMIRQIINQILGVQLFKQLFKQILVSEKQVFKDIEYILFSLIKKQIEFIKKYKKTVIYNFSENIKISDAQILQTLQGLFLQILLLKQQSIDKIIGLFQKLKRKQIEFCHYFKILLKLYKENINQQDKVYIHLINKIKTQHFTSSSTYICLKQQLCNFLKKSQPKDFADILNNQKFLQIFQMLIPYQNNQKQLIKVILIKYLTLQRIQSIPLNYWMHINSLKQYPSFSNKTIKLINLYKIQNTMVKQSYLRLICRNYLQICQIQPNTKDESEYCFQILGFIICKIPEISIRQLEILIQAFIQRKLVISSKNILADFTQDILFLKLIQIIAKNYLTNQSELQTQQQYKIQNQIYEQKKIIQLLIKIYKPCILQNIQRYIGTIQQEQKVNVRKQFQNLSEMKKLNLNRNILIKYLIPHIKKYAQQPLNNFFTINKIFQKIQIPKYKLKKTPKNYSPKSIKKYNIEEIQNIYQEALGQSCDYLCQYYKSYENQFRKIQQQWQKNKKSNNFWIYFMSKQKKSFGIDTTQNIFRSRINIKTHKGQKNNNSIKFPRRKNSSIMRFKNSFDNNSSIHLSQNQSQPNFTQSMIIMIQPRQRKNSMNKNQQLITNKQVIQIFDCQYVKPKGIYFGKITYHQNPNTHQVKLIFKANLNQQLNKCNLPIHDKYMKLSTCQHLRIYQQKEKIIYLNCSDLYTRRYILRPTALQIFSQGKTYFFNFFHQRQRQRFIQKVKLKVRDCIVNRKYQFKKRQFTQKWKHGKISNFQYLMLINTYSGRSYQDISQYPVFPWTINNFKAQKIDKQFLSNQNNFRDLSLPMGKLNEERFGQYQSRQKQIYKQNPKQDFLYGSFYSNPTIVSHYLIRLQPFTTLHWKYQSKKFDHADRLFSNIEQQYISSTTNTSDLKQLTPEFYSFPQFLKNRNDFFFGIKHNKNQVNDVQKPKWSKTPQQFIFKMRQALQSQYVSKNLNKWIDLIFGFKSIKNNAKKYDNLFHFRTYQHDIFTQYQDQDEQEDLKVAQTYVSQFGQVPETLFEQKHVQKDSFENQQLNAFINLGNYPFPQKFYLSSQGIFIIKKGAIQIITYLNSVFDQKFNKIEIKLNPKCLKVELMKSNQWNWLQISKNQIILCNQKTKQNLNINMSKNSCFLKFIQNNIITNEEFNFYIYTIKKQKIKERKLLSGHQDTVYLVEYCKYNNIIVSIDRDNFVALNYRQTKKFIRHFNLDLSLNQQIKSIRIHPLGFIFFLSTEDIFYAYTFSGDRFFSTAFKFYNNQQLTDFNIYSPDKSNILLATNSGQIFSIDLFQIYDFRKLYPERRYFKITRCHQNILNGICQLKCLGKKRQKQLAGNKQKIIQFIVDWSDKPFCKIFILYENGDLYCIFNQKNKSKKINIHEQIEEIGFI